MLNFIICFLNLKMKFLLINAFSYMLFIFHSNQVYGDINNFFTKTYNKTTARFLNKEISLVVGQTKINQVGLTNPITVNNASDEHLILQITYQSDSSHRRVENQTYIGNYIIKSIPDITIDYNVTGYVTFNITAINIGSVYIGVNSSNWHFVEDKSMFCEIQVVHTYELIAIGTIIGWMYFIAWTISFYPQIIYNIHKRNVVGLNFDFLIYNWIGFFSYSVFNIGLFWIDSIKKLYKQIYPIGVIPVQLNDVIFSLHALLIVSVQLVLCCIFERNGQRVSKFAWGFASLMILYIIIIAILAATMGVRFTWLDFMYYISYLKLFITITKYIPQAFMNYRRKSTVGWSIWAIFLDFTGGTLSIFQMIILSFNNNDWKGFFGDPTKFGLGLVSIMFDIVFFVQHYILYRKSPMKYYETLENNESTINDD